MGVEILRVHKFAPMALWWGIVATQNWLGLGFLSLSKEDHRCGRGETSFLSPSMPGFDPRSGQFSWFRFFRGFSSIVRQMLGKLGPQPSADIIGHYNHRNYSSGRQWSLMLTRPKCLIYCIYLPQGKTPVLIWPLKQSGQKDLRNISSLSPPPGIEPRQLSYMMHNIMLLFHN